MVSGYIDKLVMTRSEGVTRNVIEGLAHSKVGAVPEGGIPSFEAFLRFLRLESGYTADHVHFMTVEERCGTSRAPLPGHTRSRTDGLAPPLPLAPHWISMRPGSYQRHAGPALR